MDTKFQVSFYSIFMKKFQILILLSKEIGHDYDGRNRTLYSNNKTSQRRLFD